jgi:hypothetical protein
MKPAIFLRIAAALALLEAAGHTFLFVSYTPSHGPEEIAVVEAMKSHAFKLGGVAPHSYWELYFGYGLFATVSCLIEVGVLWQLASLVKTAPAQVRSMAAIFFAGEAGYTFLIWRYFSFPIPLASHISIALCLVIVFLTAGQSSPAEERRKSS